MGLAETDTALIEVKVGDGPWRVTYKDGTVVMIETWETLDDGTVHAHHVLRKTTITQIIPPTQE